ncbi:MAG: galactokinase family protein [Ethanoligenens sp.]
MKERIQTGQVDHWLTLLYGETAVTAQRKRYLDALDVFEQFYGGGDVQILSVPGRSEVGGNHTDHNHGRVLACSVDLDVIAVTRKTEGQRIRLHSEGFGTAELDLETLHPLEDEQFTSKALIRGTAARLKALGYTIGGFDAYTTSNVLKGSGLSSSAAFEVMCANIFSHLFNGGQIDAVTMAKAGQYAERVFFGKPCGLMDQMASAVGGFIYIDFADSENPVVEKIDLDIAQTGYTLCIVDTAGNHADLNADYASVQSEMKAVAALLGHDVLRECNEERFFTRLPEIRRKLGDRAVLRALHFFGDNARVPAEVAALRERNLPAFLRLVVQSGRSSFQYLQNVYSIQTPKQQGLSIALALSEKILEKDGAWRVHGGGFAGTIQAFVPNESVDAYEAKMNRVFGEHACYRLRVRQVGAAHIPIENK